jgi:GDP-D-mannose dehydratase
MAEKIALVTGVTGQDRAHLAELLLSRGYIVHGVTGETLVRIDPRYFRPTEVDLLMGDASKARDKLGWTHTTSFRDMIAEMVAADRDAVLAERERRDRHG